MLGIAAALNIAKGALAAQQTAMQVTAHNIANVSTPGYSRQRVDLQSQAPVSASRIKLGDGVQVASVVQALDRYTSQAIRQNESLLAENEAKASVLSHLENILDETADRGLSQAMNEFWNAWQDLANNPGRTPERTALLEKSEVLSRRFNLMSDELHQVASNTNTSIAAALAEVNLLGRQVAVLNGKIVPAEAGGTPENDLRDQRQYLAAKLTGLLSVTVLEKEDGSWTVMNADGLPLVDGIEHWDLTQAGNNIYWNGIPRDVSRGISGGKIGGWLDIRDEIIPGYLADLDELAGTFIAAVNQRHRTGYTLSGEQGKNFFADFRTPPELPHAADYRGAAAYIQLSADVAAQPENVAAGGLSGSPGDNEKAMEIAALQTDETMQVRKWSYAGRGRSPSSTWRTQTLDDYYRTLAGGIGTLSEDAARGQEFTRSLLDRLGELRDSVSGVNLDEELTEMMKIQRAHEAAAKLIAAADEMLQALLKVR